MTRIVLSAIAASRSLIGVTQKTDVVENFAVNAIETEGDQWAKEGILRDADHHFDAVR